MLFNLTCGGGQMYNTGMKKLISFLMLCAILLVSGCGVKSELVRPDGSFPRDYPIY